MKKTTLPKGSIDSIPFPAKYKDFLHRNEKGPPKIHMEPQKTQNSQDDPGKKKMLGASQYLTMLKQHGIGLRTNNRPTETK